MENFGQRLYLTGVASNTSEADLREFIYKYTHLEPASIERVDLDTASPTYVIEFAALKDGEIQQIVTRVNGLYWQAHQVVAHVI